MTGRVTLPYATFRDLFAAPLLLGAGRQVHQWRDRGGGALPQCGRWAGLATRDPCDKKDFTQTRSGSSRMWPITRRQIADSGFATSRTCSRRSSRGSRRTGRDLLGKIRMITLENRHTGERLSLRRVKRGVEVWLELKGSLAPRRQGPPMHIHLAEDEEGRIAGGTTRTSRSTSRGTPGPSWTLTDTFRLSLRS